MSNETGSTGLKKLLQRYLPILRWLPEYKPSWLRYDLISGLTIWAVLVPQAMAYAGIAGVPPIMGLYTIPIPLFLYAVLGRVPGERTYYRDIQRRTDAETIPGLLIFRFDARLIFFNCNFFTSEVKRCIAEAKEPVKTVLIDAEAMNDIDITGADRLIKLNTELNSKNIVMSLSHVRDPLRDKMRRMGVEGAIGADHIYETTRDGVDGFRRIKENAAW